MTDENKPEELSNEELAEIASSAPAPDEYPEGQADVAREVQPPENGLDEASVALIEESEKVTDSSAVQTFDAGVTALQQSVESLGERPSDPHEAHAGAHAHSDTTVLFGREYPFPIYTMVFFALGALTIFEVLFAELFYGGFAIAVLMGIAIVKAGLVVYYYMHLNTDSRVFAVTLALPVLIALLSALFLLAVPTGNY